MVNRLKEIIERQLIKANKENNNKKLFTSEEIKNCIIQSKLKDIELKNIIRRMINNSNQLSRNEKEKFSEEISNISVSNIRFINDKVVLKDLGCYTVVENKNDLNKIKLMTHKFTDLLSSEKHDMFDYYTNENHILFKYENFTFLLYKDYNYTNLDLYIFIFNDVDFETERYIDCNKKGEK